jgi:hypothetical protein
MERWAWKWLLGRWLRDCGGGDFISVSEVMFFATVYEEWLVVW